MRKLTVLNNVSLDGVMQAPGRSEEDTRGGFDRGGWAEAYNDAVKGEEMGKGMLNGPALVFGRRTYEDFYDVWHGARENPFTEVLDNTAKYVASTTASEPLRWQNSTLLEGEAGDALTELKHTEGPDLLIMGSNVLVESLRRRAGLIDLYTLMIHPLVLGQGWKQFPDGCVPEELQLHGKPIVTGTGVIIATYAPAEG